MTLHEFITKLQKIEGVHGGDLPVQVCGFHTKVPRIIVALDEEDRDCTTGAGQPTHILVSD